MRYVVTTLVVLLAAHTFSQPANGQYIETSPLSTTDTYLTSGDTTVTLGVNVQDTSVFNRRRRAAIEFGMNWGSSAASTTATSLFGLSLIDDYPRNMVGGLTHFEKNRPVRIIAALTEAYQATPNNSNFGDIHSFYSNGIATQVDPEVTLAGGQPPTTYPNTDQTGAVHGFGFRHGMVIVKPSYVSLASVATPPTNMTLVLRGNSNSGVMYGTPTQRGAWGDWRNNREQNGNRIYVTVRLRRGAAVPDTLTDDSVVLRLQLYDRDPKAPKVGDQLDSVPLLFATVPELGSSDSRISTYPDAANTVIKWNNERGKYWKAMSDRDSLGEKNVGFLEDFERLGTVPSEGEIPLRRVFDITAGMLRALPAADDGTSEWVEFSASVEFKRTIQNRVLDEYEPTAGFDNDNSKRSLVNVTTDNPGFDEKRLVVDDPNDPSNPKVLINTNELSLEVYYAQNAAVDIDWIRFETPHARRILRDEYRYEIARGVKKFVDFFKDSIAIRNSGHRILGIRLMEELDEEGWLVQRYMHRLLNGYAVTEQHGHPNNRWRHVVGASDLASATALPTWHWNGSSNYHPRAETPAPYVHVGHGGNWFSDSLAHVYLKPTVPDSIVRLSMLTAWRNSVTQAFLDLKFGMRRAFIDRNIRFDTSGVPKYRSTSGDLTDLEVGDVDATFPTWWNGLSAYELEYGGQVKPSIIDDSATFDYLKNRQNSYDSLVGSDVFTANSDMPLQMGIDNARYQYVYRSDNNAHLFKSRPWLEQIWCYNRYKGVYSSADSNQSMLQHDALRPHTAEELRLSLASAMIFGAKGYMFFAGSAGHDYTEDNEELYERGMWNHNHEGGGPCSNLISSTCALSTCPTTASLDSLIWGNDTTTSSHFGDDFPIGYDASQDPNSALIPRFFKKLDGQRRGFIISNKRIHGAEVFKTDPNNEWMLYNNVNASGLEPTEVYVGFKSPRREILRHVEKITSKAPAPLEQTSGASSDVTWSEFLSELSLRAWHGNWPTI